jgi:hypothetical protein
LQDDSVEIKSDILTQGRVDLPNDPAGAVVVASTQQQVQGIRQTDVGHQGEHERCDAADDEHDLPPPRVHQRSSEQAADDRAHPGGAVDEYGEERPPLAGHVLRNQGEYVGDHATHAYASGDARRDEFGQRLGLCRGQRAETAKYEERDDGAPSPPAIPYRAASHGSEGYADHRS